MPWRRPISPLADPTSIGNLAISKGYATKEQVAAAARKQEQRTPLGMIMVEQGIITETQLVELLIDQEVRRKHLNPIETAALWRNQRCVKIQEVVGAFHGFAAALNKAAVKS